MSVKDRAIRSDAVKWLANYLTPRNVGRYFGYTAMRATVEILWNRQLRTRDLTAVLCDHFVQRGATVIDVGASWGLYSYHLAHRAGKEGALYSYEPHPANAVVLQKLAKAQSHVRFRPVALSDAARRAEMLTPRLHNRLVPALSSLAHGFEGLEGVEVERLEVPTVRLDDDVGTSVQVDFVKIDVEGHERAVLEGGASMFRRWLPPLLIEIEQRHLTVPIADVFQYLQELGYHLYYVDGLFLRPIADFDLRRDQESKLMEGQFNRFSIGKEYVNNFCAVRAPQHLEGLPLQRFGSVA